MSEDRAAFIRQERDALHAHMLKHLVEDMTGRSPVTYSRTYRCGCGYATARSEAIYDHCGGACATPIEVRP